MNESYALITGSTSGIGLEIAYILAEKGFNLVLTARRKALLKKFSKHIKTKYKVNVDYIDGDLSDKNTPNKIYEFCNSNNSSSFKPSNSVLSIL